MKLSDVTREQFFSLLYSFLLEMDIKYNCEDCYELMEKFLKDFEMEGD